MKAAEIRDVPHTPIPKTPPPDCILITSDPFSSGFILLWTCATRILTEPLVYSWVSNKVRPLINMNYSKTTHFIFSFLFTYFGWVILNLFSNPPHHPPPIFNLLVIVAVCTSTSGHADNAVYFFFFLMEKNIVLLTKNKSKWIKKEVLHFFTSGKFMRINPLECTLEKLMSSKKQTNVFANELNQLTRSWCF